MRASGEFSFGDLRDLELKLSVCYEKCYVHVRMLRFSAEERGKDDYFSGEK